MGKVTTNWLTPGHSGSPCHHDDIYTKMNKKTGAVYSVKLCNPSDSCNELQATGRNAFGVVSAALSAWINANKDPETADYKKVKAQYERQSKYSSIRGLMMALGMYTVNDDGEVVVDVNARTNFKLVRDKIKNGAVVVPDADDTEETVTLTLSVNDDTMGTITPAAGGHTYAKGTTVTLSASPESGHSLTQWSDGNKDNPRTLTLTEDMTLEAQFQVGIAGGEV